MRRLQELRRARGESLSSVDVLRRSPDGIKLRRPEVAVGGARTFPWIRDDVDHNWPVPRRHASSRAYR